MGPDNGSVSLPLPVGGLSNACSAKFDLEVDDEVVTRKILLIDVRRATWCGRRTRDLFQHVTFLEESGMSQRGQGLGELPSGVRVMVGDAQAHKGPCRTGSRTTEPRQP